MRPSYLIYLSCLLQKGLINVIANHREMAMAVSSFVM